MSLVKLQVNRISYSQNQSGAYALILDEVGGVRKLPVIIGEFEAQSIAVALDDDIQLQRPFTHDLFRNFSARFEIRIKRVIIQKLVDELCDTWYLYQIPKSIDSCKNRFLATK